MKTNNTTPWFTNGEKPAYVGVYNVSCQRKKQSGTWYSYWDGEYFHWFCSDVTDAYYENRIGGAGNAVLTKGSWRGLASKPEGFEEV